MLDTYNITLYVCDNENTIINQKLDQIMANIQQLNAKVDELQTALDAEQEEVRLAIEALNQSIADLQAMVTEGGTAEERQALADKLESIKSDLEGTISSKEPEEPVDNDAEDQADESSESTQPAQPTVPNTQSFRRG